MNINESFHATAIGPINIALIKYWGKSSDELITPLNNSISLTLSTEQLRTETTITITPITSDTTTTTNDIITLIINNKETPITSRIRNVISIFKSLAQAQNIIHYPYYTFNITSTNTFPTASGCASSASSMSALVTCLNNAFQLNLSLNELSAIARRGSGSACRSVHGGIVEWLKEGDDNSHAVQLYDKDYWDIGVMLVIVNTAQKEISSSKGMQLTKETSKLFHYRINSIVDEHINEIKDAFKYKNFHKLATVTMKDCNNFHAVCRDTYPSICYLNEHSEFIIKAVNYLNSLQKDNQCICAYTFDAGANAFIIFENKNIDIINNYFDKVLFDEYNNDECVNEYKDIILKRNGLNNFQKKVFFTLGNGAHIVSTN
jgi:diphosphomevalonate decarboxylase